MSDKTSTTSKEQRKNRNRRLKLQPGGRPIFLRDPSRHLRLHRCEDEIANASDCDVILSQRAYRQIMKHLEADTTREHGGLLLGYRDRSESPTPPPIWITTSLPADHTRGDPTSLTFTEDTWLKFQEQTDELTRLGVSLERLGWYHSHPGLEIFLSRWDLDVCTNFDQPHHVALVVDPIRGRGGFFPRGERGYRPREPKGFWEYSNLTSDSVVEWENVYEISSEWRMPAYEVLPVEVIEEPVEPEMSIEEEELTETQTTGETAEPLKTQEGSQEPEAEPVPQNVEAAGPEISATVTHHKEPVRTDSEQAATAKTDQQDPKDKKGFFTFARRTVSRISKTFKGRSPAAP
jgi:proteasome lid subunit RPN8/RPN11